MPESWWLKVDRAQYHLDCVEDEMRRYARRHPYEPERVVQSKSKQSQWVYVLRMTEQPNPMLATMVGDVIHNARSALDHTVVALASTAKERKKASFPIALKDPWELSESGEYVVTDDETRERFDRAIRGLPDDAQALIKSVQPYVTDEPDMHPLGVLSRLENADKHRRLIALASGVSDTRTLVYARGNILAQPGRGLRDEGAEVAHFTAAWTPPLQESEVHVQVRGTPRVTLRVADIDGHFALPDSLQVVIDTVTDTLALLEMLVT